MNSSASTPAYSVAEATSSQRDAIYRHRHDVYAREIGQHLENESRTLQDSLDLSNRYLVVTHGSDLAGFISITPPGDHGYSIDKYFDREDLPFQVDRQSYELRLLTVLPQFRHTQTAAILMFAAFRWIESRGGLQIIAIGRREVSAMYRRCGMNEVGRSTRSGAVTYDLMHGSVRDIRQSVEDSRLPARIEHDTHWNLGIPLRKPADCFHGGAFFEAIGTGFKHLDRRRDIINTDVLDAWFPPAPAALDALHAELPWLLRTSPPTDCEGLVRAIARAPNIPESSILVGAGSSDLIYRALPRWLDSGSTALILDPTYGEYAHILEKVIGCSVVRATLDRETDYLHDFEQLAGMIAAGPDLVALVNPNSPTGKVIDADTLKALISIAPTRTRFWIDETYIDYAGGPSLEGFAADHDRLIICKSMSKAYALSGARVAYLCASPHQLEELRSLTPPWIVGLPSQVAAVKALEDPAYYEHRWQETAELRRELEAELEELGFHVTPGCANFVLTHLPERLPDADWLVEACRERGLFIRNASPMGEKLGRRAIRIAVKDRETQGRIVQILHEVLGTAEPSNRPTVPCTATASHTPNRIV